MKVGVRCRRASEQTGPGCSLPPLWRLGLAEGWGSVLLSVEPPPPGGQPGLLCVLTEISRKDEIRYANAYGLCWHPIGPNKFYGPDQRPHGRGLQEGRDPWRCDPAGTGSVTVYHDPCAAAPRKTFIGCPRPCLLGETVFSPDSIRVLPKADPDERTLVPMVSMRRKPRKDK